MPADLSIVTDAVLDAFGEDVTIVTATLGAFDASTGRRATSVSDRVVTADVSGATAEPGLDGNGLVEQRVVRMRIADLSTFPTASDRVKLRGHEFQVVSIDTTVGDSMVEVRVRRKL